MHLSPAVHLQKNPLLVTTASPLLSSPPRVSPTPGSRTTRGLTWQVRRTALGIEPPDRAGKAGSYKSEVEVRVPAKGRNFHRLGLRVGILLRPLVHEVLHVH